MSLNTLNHDDLELSDTRATSALNMPPHSISTFADQTGYNAGAGSAELDYGENLKFCGTRMPSLLEPIGGASGSAELKRPLAASSHEDRDEVKSSDKHTIEEEVEDSCMQVLQTDACLSDGSDPEVASQSTAGQSSNRGTHSDVVHQGKWARLKQAERTWRANMISLRTSDPQMGRCQNKVFNIFEAQCVALRCRVHERLVRGQARGEFHIAEQELEHVFQAMEDFLSKVSTPLAFTEEEQQDKDEQQLEDGSGDGNVAEIAMRQRLENGATSESKYGKRVTEWSQSHDQLAAIELALNQCLDSTYRQEGDEQHLEDASCDRNTAEIAMHQGLECGAAPWPSELGISKKESVTTRRKYGKRVKEWNQSRDQLAADEPTLNRCLERTYKDLGKACLRVKYGLHLLVHRQQGCRSALNLAEIVLDSILTRTGDLLRELTARGPSCPLPVASNEMAAEHERYLFQAARLDELVDALETMDLSISCPSPGQ